MARGDKYTSFNFHFTLCQVSRPPVGLPSHDIACPACVVQPSSRTGAPRAQGQCCHHYGCGGIWQYFDGDWGPLPQTFPELINCSQLDKLEERRRESVAGLAAGEDTGGDDDDVPLLAGMWGRYSWELLCVFWCPAHSTAWCLPPSSTPLPGQTDRSHTSDHVTRQLTSRGDTSQQTRHSVILIYTGKYINVTRSIPRGGDSK